MQLKDLSPNDKNPRTVTPEKLDLLKKSLNEFGDLSGIVFNKKSKKLVGGHQRKVSLSPDSKIVIEKKYSKPTKTGTVAEGYVTENGERFSYREVFWNQAKEKAANIAANKGAGEWDSDLLSEWMKELDEEGFNLDLTMFDEIERQLFLEEPQKKGLCDEDEIPDKVPAKTKLSDLYQLGEHRLLCGDSTDIQHVERLMNGEKADMVFTDPPYQMETEGGGLYRQGKNPAMKKIRDLGIDNFDPAVLSLHCVTNVFFCNRPLIPKYLELAQKNKVAWDLAVYHKKSVMPTHSGHLMVDLEYILILGKQGPRNGVGLPHETYSKLYSGGKDSDNETAWSKPVELCEKFINLYTSKSVLDLFGGSGSTLIACEKTNRKCFMLELDPHYCDVIVARWEKYTGKKAVKQDKNRTANAKKTS